MKKILILALLLSSLFANDKFSNLANAANSVVKNDKWINYGDSLLYILSNGNKELSISCNSNESVMLSLIDSSTDKSYTTNFISVFINNKEERILSTFTYREDSELNIHNLNYFLNDIIPQNVKTTFSKSLFS